MSRDLLPIASRQETVRTAWRLVAAHPAALTAAVLSFAVAGLSGLVPPWVLGQLVDDIRSGGDADDVTRVALLIAGSGVIAAISSGLAVAFLARAGEPALAKLREEVLDRALHLDAARVESAGVGDLLSRVGDDVRMIADALVRVIPTLVTAIVTISFTAVGLLTLDWRLGLVGLLTVPAYAGALRWYLPRSSPRYRDERIAQGERAEVLVSSIEGSPTVRAYALEREHQGRVEATSQRAVDIALDVFGLLTRFFTRINATELLGLGLVIGAGFWLVREDLSTVGAVTAAALYFHRLFNPIGALLLLFDELQSTGASLARLAGVAGLPVPEESVDVLPATPGALVLAGVGHEYVAGRPVLTATDLRLEPGRRIALVGATGAGKTTLGAVAAGVLRPTHGEVTLAGIPFAALPAHAVRRRVVLVSQDVHVFSGTVRDAVTLARADASDDEVLAALAVAHAGAWVAALPDGLDTLVGDGAHRVTAAQAQQLALARVVLADPWVVVLDEATAEAGSAGARELEAAALAVTEGRGALVVAHRLTQARTADEILVLHDGEVVERGTHDELLARRGRYGELWAAWSAAD
ncbi:ABC transporter ATP-binding protein [Nocardioides pacificus]